MFRLFTLLSLALFLSSPAFSLSYWTLRHPAETASTVGPIYWLGDRLFTTDTAGQALYSKDGQTWRKADSVPRFRLGSISVDKDRLIAFSQDQEIYVSTDRGWSWKLFLKGHRYQRIIWAGNQFVGSYEQDYEHIIATSPDGVHWTPRHKEYQYYHVDHFVYNGKVILATLPEGRVLRSEDGVKWDLTGTPSYSQAYRIFWTGEFFALHDWNENIYTSSDGDKWELQAEGSIPVFSGRDVLPPLIWSGTHLLGVLDDTLYQSRDGKNWTRSHFQLHQAPASFEGFGSEIRQIGIGNLFPTSPDGSTWSAFPGYRHVHRIRWNAVTWTGSRALAVGRSGAFGISPDGLEWREGNIGTGLSAEKVAWSGRQAMALGDSLLASTTDLEKWSVSILPSGTGRLRSVAWTGKNWLAVGEKGTLLTSADGQSWKKFSWTYPDSLWSVFSNGRITVVAGGRHLRFSGMGNILLTTTDGVTFERRVLPDGEAVGHGLWDGQRFVSVGGSLFTTSLDGLRWPLRFIAHPIDPQVFELQCLAWNGQRYMAGGHRPAHAERDSAWHFDHGYHDPEPRPGPYKSIVWAGSRWIGINNSNEIITAEDAPSPTTSLSGPVPAGLFSARTEKGGLVLTFPPSFRPGNGLLTLSTLSGQKVLSLTLPGEGGAEGRKRIPLPALGPGLYTLEARSGGMRLIAPLRLVR